MHTLRLAEQLGAETVTLSGENVSEELLNYARTRNVSKIVVGKPRRPRWKEFVFGAVVDELARNTDDIDVYVIGGEHDDSRPPALRLPERTSDGAAYGWALAVVTGLYGAGLAALSRRLKKRTWSWSTCWG